MIKSSVLFFKNCRVIHRIGLRTEQCWIWTIGNWTFRVKKNPINKRAASGRASGLSHWMDTNKIRDLGGTDFVGLEIWSEFIGPDSTPVNSHSLPRVPFLTLPPPFKRCRLSFQNRSSKCRYRSMNHISPLIVRGWRANTYISCSVHVICLQLNMKLLIWRSRVVRWSLQLFRAKKEKKITTTIILFLL